MIRAFSVCLAFVLAGCATTQVHDVYTKDLVRFTRADLAQLQSTWPKKGTRKSKLPSGIPAECSPSSCKLVWEQKEAELVAAGQTVGSAKEVKLTGGFSKPEIAGLLKVMDEAKAAGKEKVSKTDAAVMVCDGDSCAMDFKILTVQSTPDVAGTMLQALVSGMIGAAVK